MNQLILRQKLLQTDWIILINESELLNFIMYLMNGFNYSIVTHIKKLPLQGVFFVSEAILYNPTIRAKASSTLALFSRASACLRLSSATTAAGALSTKLGLESLRS